MVTSLITLCIILVWSFAALPLENHFHEAGC